MSVDLQTKDSFTIPSQVNEIPCSNHESNKKPFMNKHRSNSSFGSLDFGSSVESELSSTSTESEFDEEEDFVAELTRQMANSMLEEDDIIDHKKGYDVSGYSESTSMVGKLENLKKNEEMNQYYYNFKERFYNTSLKTKQALIDEQIKAIQQNEEKQQIGKFQSNRGFSCGGVKNGSKTGSSGTGVFLPRIINKTSESTKKQGCSTVLIPAKVVQALKLHFDKMDVNSRPRGARSFLFQHGDVRYGLQLHQKSQSETVPAMNYNQEIGLPQDWTY